MTRATGKLAWISAVLSVGAVTVFALSISGNGGRVADVGDVVAPSAAPASATAPLDSYFGFGRSPDTAVRDNAVAYWEAYQRELVIASCMGSQGFSYAASVQFPEDATKELADWLQVLKSRSDPKAAAPAVRNKTYEAGLSVDVREKYNQALWGESAADISSVNSSGVLPPGRGDDFATGGCYGQANAQVPSIWALPRQLNDQVVAMRLETQRSPKVVQASADYKNCASARGLTVAAASPADVDEALAKGTVKASEANDVASACGPTYTAAYRSASGDAAVSFIAKNRQALDATQQRYNGIVGRIRGDAKFKAYLAEQLWYSEAARAQ